MANAIYPLYKQALLQGSTNTTLNAAEGSTGVYAELVDTGVYTYNAAHQFYDDLSGIIGSAQEITTKTQTNGTFDGNDITFSSVSGNTAEALVIYRQNAGANSTWRLVAYLDTGVGGLPVTPNGTDIIVTWNASGIFTL